MNSKKFIVFENTNSNPLYISFEIFRSNIKHERRVRRENKYISQALGPSQNIYQGYDIFMDLSTASKHLKHLSLKLSNYKDVTEACKT